MQRRLRKFESEYMRLATRGTLATDEVIGISVGFRKAVYWLWKADRRLETVFQYQSGDAAMNLPEQVMLDPCVHGARWPHPIAGDDVALCSGGRVVETDIEAAVTRLKQLRQADQGRTSPGMFHDERITHTVASVVAAFLRLED